MNENVITALNDLAESDRLLAKAAAALNCKPSEVKTVIGSLAYEEGLKVVTARNRLNQAVVYSVTSPGTPGESLDTDKAKEALLKHGLPVPMKPRKGASASLRKA